MIDEPEVGAAVARRVAAPCRAIAPGGWCSSRVPSFSAAMADGRKKTSVPISSRRQLAALHDAGLSARNSPSRSSRNRAPPATPAAPGRARTRSELHRADHGVLAEHELALHHAFDHRQRHRQLRMVAGQLRQVVVAEFIVRLRVCAIPGLQQAEPCISASCSTSRSARVSVSRNSSSVCVRMERIGLRQVGRQHVVERRDVGAALDAGSARAAP